MSKNKILQPDFKLSFLLPHHWLTWLGVIVLYTISWLPYKLQLFLGRVVGKVLYRLGSKRKNFAMKNLALCFPEMPPQERVRMIKKNFENTGIALFETGMGWWWPNWRIKRKIAFKGLEHIEKSQAEGKGILLLSMHYLSIEFCCTAIGNKHPMVVFYRPHNNPLMEFFQFRGRGRANKYMLGKRDVKGLMKALRDGESCVYFPDQDYGRNRSLFVPFFAVEKAATTTGTLIFARQKNTESIIVTPKRNEDGSGYTVEFSSPLVNFPSGDDEADVIRVNQEMEKSILRQPDQYMWLHRRFKTRPDKNAPSLYN